ncbi:protein PHYTOCHROME KINASE SUBSTRATE 4-like [Phoenix dactylifera]|uniref:Protein PHYTOCHROME KINASE SUBSTRATE 4-like n=1 Tax=Phoenix dactylifera TaxID=42345 RepID=A0A8B8ZRH4_PHODC|nr:protein PHYTOCHROME KINASE SUBSTRATE 4-like [Phoenix dactylifera]XP_038975952.1 protein PHYTOCHROME KINASE SUBSTRATE 4-like [Phoenix dactylifera]
MEKYRVTASFNGGLSHRPPSSSISLPPKPHHLCEPPISSFLPPGSPKPAAASGDHLGRRTSDAEISIFDAERYFLDGSGTPDVKRTIILNGTARCDLSTNPRDSSVSSVDGGGGVCGRAGRNGSFHATPTPTASSETSWNSRCGLLCNPPGSIAVAVKSLPLKEPKKGISPSSSFGVRRLFGRGCPCSGKKSVDVEENYPEPPKNPSHSKFDSSRSAVSRSKNPIFRTGEVGHGAIGDKSAPKDIKSEWGIAEGLKLKINTGNWAEDPEACHVSKRFSREKPFPVEIGHRIVSSDGAFNESSGFSFPVLNPRPANPNPPEDPARDSLEVFRPSDEATVLKKSTEFPRRAPTTVPFSGEADRRSFTYPTSPKTRPPEEDQASDTSSDLFEIESFSTSYPSSVNRRRDSLDELDTRRLSGGGAAAAGILQLHRSLEEPATPSIAASECCPPSEVSVQWSVTTAEGFDRASVANFSSATSDYEELSFIQAEHDRFATAMAAGEAKRRGGGGGGLLRCRCEKAISVAPNPVRCGPVWSRAGASVFTVDPDRVSGFAAKLAGGTPGQERPVLPRSLSTRVSRPVQTR